VECNVERSHRTQTRLPRVLDAPVRGQTLVRNRSAEALLIWIWRTRFHESAISAGGRLLVVTLFARFTTFATVRFELRLQLFKLGLLLCGQNGLHFLIELKSFTHQLGLQTRHFR